MLAKSRFPLLLSLMFVAGCGGSDGNPTDPGDTTQSVARIQVTPGTKTISYGDTLHLTASAYDKDGAEVSNASISWTSLSPDIATVDGSGNVTTVALGDVTIVASSGDAQDSASISVDYAHFALQASQPSGQPFQLLPLTLPAGAPALQTGQTLTATLGSDSVTLVATSATELALEVPDMAPGDYALSVALDDFSLGEGQITVLAAPVVTDADAVVNSVTSEVSDRLDSLSSVGNASATDVQAARTAVTSLRDWLKVASADDRLTLAKIISANTAALAVSPVAPANRGPQRIDTYKNNEEVDIANVLAATQQLMAYSLANDLGPCTDGGFSSLPCGVLSANAMLFVHTMLAYAVSVRRLANEPILPTGNVSVKPALDSTAVEPLDFTDGAAVPLTVTAEHRTVAATDLASTGTAGSIASTVLMFSDTWTSLQDWLAQVEQQLSYPVTLTDTPPALASESTTAMLTLNGDYLSLDGTDNSAVACSMTNAAKSVVLTCTTDEQTDQDFNFGLKYDNQAFSATVSVAAVLHIAVDPCAEATTLTLDGGSVAGALTDSDCVDPGRPGAADADVSGAYDTYVLSSTSPMSVRFDLSSPDFTPMMDLLTASGTYIVDDIGVPDMTTRVTLPAGSYEVRVYASDGKTLGSYTLSATSDPNSENGCGRHYYNYFAGSVTHGGSISANDCQNNVGSPLLHWDGYFEWVEAGQTVKATVKMSGPGTLSLWEPGDNNPKYEDYTTAGYHTLTRTATATGWFSTYVLANPSNNVSYTLTVDNAGASGVAGRRSAPHTPARSPLSTHPR